MTDRDRQAAVYRGMDRPALDAAYNNAAAVADSQDWVARWRARSAEVRASPGARLDIPYGPRPRARLDYLPCGRKQAPLFVFIHGGYWQRNDKETFAFVADGPSAHGIDVAIPGYTLAPEVRLTDIVEEMRQALTFLSDNAGDLGFDNRDRDLEPASDAAGPRPAAAPRRRRRRASGAPAAIPRIRRRRAGARPAGAAVRASRPSPFLDPRRDRASPRRVDARARGPRRHDEMTEMTAARTQRNG